MTIEGINLLSLSIFSVIFISILSFHRRFKDFPCLKFHHLTEKPKKRIGFFDFVKGLAIMAVILIHVILIIENFFPHQSIEYGKIINNALRFAIPVFFISSGALLFLKNIEKQTLKNFYFSKIKRVFIPYALFSFCLTYIFSEGFEGKLQYFSVAVKDLLTGGSLIPYWFIPVLFQLYIIYPFLWHLFSHKKKNFSFFVIFSFFFSLTSYYILSFNYLNLNQYLGGFPLFAPYLFFFVLGIFLKPFFFEKKEKIKYFLKKINFFTFFSLTFLIYFGLPFFFSLDNYYNVRLIYGPTAMIFIFFIYSFTKTNKAKIFLEKIGKESLYLYLLHFIIFYPIVHFISLMGLGSINFSLLFFIIAFLCFFLSYFIIIMFRKLISLFSSF